MQAQKQFKLFVLDPSSGTLVNLFSPSFAKDSNIISLKFAAFYPKNPSEIYVFALDQYKDTLNIYHQQLIKYNSTADTLIPLDSISLDTLGNMTVWEQFIINGGKLYFYLIENFGIDNTIYQIAFDPQNDLTEIVKLDTYFLPITYVPIDDNTIFTTAISETHLIYPAVYSFRINDFIAVLPLDIFKNFLITNKLRRSDTDYVVGFLFKRDEVNFAKYELISGDYMMIRYNYTDLVNSPQNTAIIFTKLQDFKNFSPYGLIDNGQGFTILGKGDAFSYFPATIILKTDYSGKPIKAYYETNR